jgi:flagellin-like protein
MQIKELLDDDRAVSPVIGVILMVAITVILAAVIGTFVLGLGDQVSQTTPSASFGFDYDRSSNDTLTISHNGGDTVDANNLNVAISGVNTSINDQYSWSSDLGGANGDVTAGSSVTVDGGNVNGNQALDISNGTVSVVWQSSEGDSSATLGRFEGPDA